MTFGNNSLLSRHKIIGINYYCLNKNGKLLSVCRALQCIASISHSTKNGLEHLFFPQETKMLVGGGGVGKLISVTVIIRYLHGKHRLLAVKIPQHMRMLLFNYSM